MIRDLLPPLSMCVFLVVATGSCGGDDASTETSAAETTGSTTDATTSSSSTTTSETSDSTTGTGTDATDSTGTSGASTGSSSTAADTSTGEAVCVDASDCDDGDPCNGFEQCEPAGCVAGEALGCEGDEIIFVVPPSQPPSPSNQLVNTELGAQRMDVYILVDRSGSMLAEITAIKNSVQQTLDAVTCAPLGSGTPPDCVPDLWSGAGSIGYSGLNGQSYTNHLDLQADPGAINPVIPTTEPTGCCDETLWLGLWSTATGESSQASGCVINSQYPARTDCTGSPAGVTGVGYPCFRDDALPVVVLATDEAPSATFACPSEAVTLAALNGIGAKFIGLAASTQTAVTDDLTALAVGTGSVDANQQPFVVQALDANAGAALHDALLSLVTSVPLDMTVEIQDDETDAVDAVASFVERIETAQLGTMTCTSGLAESDADLDTFPDTYLGVVPGTPVCWHVVPTTNTDVPATSEPQIFEATATITAGGAFVEAKTLWFVVPPA